MQSERYIGDFAEGDVYHHGAVQITPFRNRQYIKKFGGTGLAANPEICRALGFSDPDAGLKKNRFAINETALVSQGFLFNTAFGLSVHDISFNAVANLSYSRLVFGAPVFEGDTVSCRSKVLGIEFRKDGATSGSVQVETVAENQRGETVLSYVRQVLVRAAKGQTHQKSSSIKPQPARVLLSDCALPPIAGEGRLGRKFLGESGKTFEDFSKGEILTGSLERGLTLADFSWLQIATLNDAAVHHTPASLFIGYGGAVKGFCEGATGTHFPVAFQLAMNSGAHNAPAYPSDMVREFYAGGEGEHEKIRASAEVLEKSEIDGRDDFGVVTIRLTGEKNVTDAGMKALEKARFSGIDKIFEEGGKRWLRILTLEQLFAAPTQKVFR